MSRISFNVAAKCDKAGRSQNQDNYWVCPDLSRINDSFRDVIGKDKDIVLSDKGALLVVADGMGGMNAGEKASELVIKGVKEGFSNIPDTILGDDAQMLSFIKKTIQNADSLIKEYAKNHREANGLGSTIVLVWFWGEKAFCGWCGDSRIYRYNPNNELVRLSHDHSYVQELVDEGRIEPDEAFDHPDGNIVTRALGDNGETANPELKVYDICERDVFLLCSDGLCGLLQDKQIEDIIAVNCSSMKDALSALWKAGEDVGWSDNATIDLLNVVEGGIRPKGVAVGYPVKRKTPVKTSKSGNESNKDNEKVGNPQKTLTKRILFLAISMVVIVLIVAVIFHTFSKNKPLKESQDENNYVFSESESFDNNLSQDNIVDPQNSTRIERDHGNDRVNDKIRENINNNSNSNPVANSNANNAVNANNGAGPNTNGIASGNNGSPIHQEPQQQQTNSGQQQSPPQISSEYQSLFNGVRSDYQSVIKIWNTVKQRNTMTMTKNESERLNNYIVNVGQLIENSRKEPLTTNDQRVIFDQLKPLADEIKQKIGEYDIQEQQQQQQQFQPQRRRRNQYFGM